jgi:thiamine kinase-like enzyme
VIEYDVCVNGRATVTLIGKARRKRFGNADYRLLDSVWNAGFDDASHDGISVAEPIAVIGALELWLQRKAQGVVAAQLLTGPYALQLARHIAEAAFKLHCATDQIATERMHTMADELRILRNRLEEVERQHIGWATRIRAVLTGCEALGATVVPTVRGIHRDFYSDQIIVDGDRLHLIDFDLYCHGDVGVDIGNFMGHIAEQSLRELRDTAALQPIEQVIETRYVELAGEQTQRAIRVYRLLTLARHVSLSAEIPERRHVTEPLIELCEAELCAMQAWCR